MRVEINWDADDSYWQGVLVLESAFPPGPETAIYFCPDEDKPVDQWQLDGEGMPHGTTLDEVLEAEALEAIREKWGEIAQAEGQRIRFEQMGERYEAQAARERGDATD
jgi:hypothetical protein